MSNAPGEDDPSTRPSIERASGAPDDAGAGADGWVESPADEAADDTTTAPEAQPGDEPAASTTTGTSADAATETADEAETISVPRKFRKAKDGRVPETVYISTETNRELTRLRHYLEEEFPDENVRQLDVYAAVIEAGVADFEAPEKILREWGYGKELR